MIFHLKEPNATLLWNLSEGAIGIVPYGSLDEITRNPIGSGPFKFVSAEQDKEVIVERNDNYWGAKPRLARVRFAVVPDPTTRALELRKGSADAAINAMTSDTIVALEREPNLQIERAPGTVLSYLAFNTRDPILRGCSCSPSNRLCHRPRPISAIHLARLRATRSQHPSTAKLGL